MGKRLYTPNAPKTAPKRLTASHNTDFLFTPSFNRKLEPNFDFAALCSNMKNAKKLQNVLALWGNMTVNEVDKNYRRKSDDHDISEDGKQIVHYGSSGFRLHGVHINGRFEVIRIDCNHAVHD